MPFTTHRSAPSHPKATRRAAAAHPASVVCERRWAKDPGRDPDRSPPVRHMMVEQTRARPLPFATSSKLPAEKEFSFRKFDDSTPNRTPDVLFQSRWRICMERLHSRLTFGAPNFGRTRERRYGRSSELAQEMTPPSHEMQAVEAYLALGAESEIPARLEKTSRAVMK
jgi:hypothetical protein